MSTQGSAISEASCRTEALQTFKKDYGRLVTMMENAGIWPRITDESIKSTGSLGPVRMIDAETWRKYWAHSPFSDEDIADIERAGGSFGRDFSLLSSRDKMMHQEFSIDRKERMFYKWFWSRRLSIYFQYLDDVEATDLEQEAKNCIWPLAGLDRSLDCYSFHWMSRKDIIGTDVKAKVSRLCAYISGIQVRYPAKDLRKATCGLLELTEGQGGVDVYGAPRHNALGFHTDLHGLMEINKEFAETQGPNDKIPLMTTSIFDWSADGTNVVTEHTALCASAGKEVNYNHELALLLYPFEQAALAYQFHHHVPLYYYCRDTKDRVNAIELLSHPASETILNKLMTGLKRSFDADYDTLERTHMKKIPDRDGNVVWHTKVRSKWMREAIKQIVNLHGFDLADSCQHCHDAK